LAAYQESEFGQSHSGIRSRHIHWSQKLYRSRIIPSKWFLFRNMVCL